MEPTEVIDDESIETVDELPEAPKYDFSFADDSYQYYFKYENHDEGENKKQVGVCRNCFSVMFGWNLGKTHCLYEFV